MRPIRFAFLLSCALMCTGWAQAQTATAPGATVDAKSKKASKPKQKPKKAAEAEVVKPVAVAAHSDLPVELQAIADQIHTGKLPCELGQTVTLLHDAHEPGRFNLFLKNHVYHLTPVQSATGALRLEDAAKGAVSAWPTCAKAPRNCRWLRLTNWPPHPACSSPCPATAWHKDKPVISPGAHHVESLP